MLLEVYVNLLQVMDFGSTLSVGDSLSVKLVGNAGSTIGVSLPCLDVYLADGGRRMLEKVGITEYAFSGQIMDVRSIQDYGWKGLDYHEILLDCGLPIVFEKHGVSGMPPLDLDNPTNKEIVTGRYMGGLMMLQAYISFRDPDLIKSDLPARVSSIKVGNLHPNSEGRIAEPRKSVETGTSRQPLILTIEI